MRITKQFSSFVPRAVPKGHMRRAACGTKKTRTERSMSMEKYLSMVSPDDVETQILDWGQFQWLNEPRVTKAQKMIVGIGRIKPGKGHTRHNHPESEEFIYFMEGRAMQSIERPDGKQEREMGPGELISIM